MTTAVRVYKKLRGLRLQILYFITRDVKHFIQNELTKISLHKKMKFSIKDFFSKCDQIRSFMRVWSHLIKKSLMENFILCAVFIVYK